MGFNQPSSMSLPIALLEENVVVQKHLAMIAQRWQLSMDPNACFGLRLTVEGLALCQCDQPCFKPLRIDFVQGALAYRQRQACRANEALAKAVGIKGNYRPSILDATAGLGRDAAILATLGCQVQMLERHPVVAALLMDGLQRAYQDKQRGAWLNKHLKFLAVGSLTTSELELPKPEVIYLDPMFPVRRSRALVKKEMQMLQRLVGTDDDADQLLTVALNKAKRRVVVKRPKGAPPLADIKPAVTVTTPRGRFDIYPIN